MDVNASATTEQPTADHAGERGGAVGDVLGREYPETWNVVLARAAKQADTFPAGMSNETEPAYRYVPGDA